MQIWPAGEQLQQPPQRLVSLQLDATGNGASLTLTAEAQNQSATEMPQGSAGAQQHSVLGPVQSHVLKVLRHHVAQATETAAGLSGLQSNDVECKKVRWCWVVSFAA